MDVVQRIVAEQGWTDETLLSLVLDYVSENNPSGLVEYLRMRSAPEEGEAEYVTLTVVVRRVDDEEDPCDTVLTDRADVMFVGHQDGVTPTAVELGAEPGDWS
jgi:hypothetical protein